MSAAKVAHAGDERFNRLGNSPISSLLVEFSIPALIGLVVQGLYNIIDAIYVGHGVGELGLAAATVSFPSMMAMIAVSMLVGIGGNSLAAIKLGEGKKDEAEKIVAHSFVLLILTYAIFMVAGLYFLEPLLKLSGATDEVLPYAKDFMSIILVAGMVQTVSFGMNNFIRTAGNPKRALWSQLMGIGFNAIFGYLFVLVFHWGMKGAAFATAISLTISCTYVMLFFVGKNPPLRLRPEYFKLEKSLPARIMILGIPPAALQLGLSLINIVENNLIGYYGATDAVLGVDGGLAVMGVLGRVGYLTIVPAIGLSQGAQPIIGFNYGAKNFGRIIETLKKAVLIATAISTVVWLTVIIFPDFYVHLFGLPESFEEYASFALFLYLMFVPIVSLQIVGSNYFQATGQALKATILTLTRQIIFLIPLLIVTPMVAPKILPITQMQGVFFAPSISDLLSTLLVLAFIIPEIKKLKRKQEERDQDFAAEAAQAGGTAE